MIIGHRKLRRRDKGFTLIELMIVVAIIAILAAIAIPQYRKFQLNSKTSEAKTNIGAIRTCEEAYAAEHNVYYLVGPAPESNITSTTRDFDITNEDNCAHFADLGFKPAGKVYYNYGVKNWKDGTNFNTSVDVNKACPNGIGAITDGAMKNGVRDVTADIAILAQGDLDNDGKDSYYGATDEKGEIVHGGDDF